MIIKAIDKIGMFSSAACALHCIFLPLLITILPFFGMSFLVDEIFEIIMLAISLILAILSLCLGYKTHRNKKMFFVFSLGVSLLLLGRFAHENHWGTTSLIILFFGGLTVSCSHFINNKLCNNCNGCTTGK